MNRLFSFIVLACSYILCGAQATTLTIDNQTPGWLSSKINYGDQQTVENLTVTGYLNPTDLAFIGTLIKSHSLHGKIDLTNTQIVDANGVLTNKIADIDCFNVGNYRGDEISHLLMSKFITKAVSRSLSLLKIDSLTIGSYNMPIMLQEYFGLTNNTNGDNHVPVKTLIFREGVTEIGKNFYNLDHARYKENNLKQIVMPSTLKIIGEAAFNGNDSLKTISIPNTVTTIGPKAFVGTSFMPDTLWLPDSLELYEIRSFELPKEQVVIVPKKIQYLKLGHFYQDGGYDIDSSDKITFYMTSHDMPKTINDVKSCLAGSTFYVRKDLVDTYKQTPPFDRATILAAIESITISSKSIDLKAGENAQLSFELLPENAIDKSVSWHSSDDSIVRIDEFGKITAVSAGTAKVYVTSNYDNALSDYCDITVTQPVTGVVLNETSIDLPENGNFKLNATVIPDNATNKTVTWNSSDVSVAMVTADGMVYGIKAGKATIMVTTEDGAFSALCKVNVNCGFVPVAEITLDTTNIEGKETEEYLIKANVLPEDASNKILLWRSSDETVASVDNTGLIRLLKKGSSIITVSATDESGVFAECIVLVSEQAGIDEVLADKNTYVKIYNLSGVLVFEGNYSDANLGSGYYIVLCGGKSHSVIVEK